ncbi:MAG TPA: gluconate transporter [Bacteroidales bacterium]|nr:gluconate transporter [Bacteroidales bacterium]
MWLIILLFLAIAFIVITTTKFKWHPFLSLLIAAIGYGAFSGTMTLEQVVKSVNTVFGNTVGFIGIVILAGSIIGTFLEKSGGAFTLAASTLKITGEKNVPLALSIMGYVISIPVFCDSGFIIISPLAKALTKQVGISFAVGAIALSLGLITTHSIIPPTPGPVGAAGILNADLGLVLILGFPVSIAALIAGWLFAVKVAPKISYESSYDTGITKSESTYNPSAAKSLFPIFAPIILIILRSVALLPSAPFGTGNASNLITFLGQPVIALLLGVFLAFLLPKKLTREMISPAGWVGEAVLAAATIIIITGCGGAFGQVLQNSGIGDFIKENLGGAKSLGVVLPILIAASLKTAQGSGTVAIVTGAGLMAPLLTPLGLDSPMAKALVVVALGSGSLIASHVNDSYFWVVTQLSKMNVNQGYKLQTFGTFTIGVVASLATWLMSLIIL